MEICKKCGKPKRNSPVVARTSAAVMRNMTPIVQATYQEPPKPYDLALEKQRRQRDAAAGIDYSAPNLRATEDHNEPPKPYDLAIAKLALEKRREGAAV